MTPQVGVRLGVLTTVLLWAPSVSFAKDVNASPPAAPSDAGHSAPSDTGQATPAPLVIELRCPWAERVTGKVALGSCVPPSCPTGWTGVGTSSCSANGIWCGAGCATVGHCSRFCTK